MNRTYDVHPFNHDAKRGEALAVRISMSAKVERRLVADADEEVRRRAVRPGARHRNRAVDMMKTRLIGTLEHDGRKP